MSAATIKDYSRSFHEQIRSDAHASETMREEVFVEKVGEILEECGEIEDLTVCSYSARGQQVDGYCFEDEFKEFVLIVSYFIDKKESSTISVTNTDIKPVYNRALGFFKNAKRAFSIATKKVIWEKIKEIVI